jgi:catechol-2,3-dioxygenase
MIGMNVERLDHVHVHVSDKKAAAAWFGEVLGLQVAAKFRN